jgi:hypothetical protein
MRMGGATSRIESVSHLLSRGEAVARHLGEGLHHYFVEGKGKLGTELAGLLVATLHDVAHLFRYIALAKT